MPIGTALVEQFVPRLRNKDEQTSAARELYVFVNGDIKENSPDTIREFLARFDTEINKMSSSDADPVSRKGAVFAIICMVKLEISGSPRGDRITRYGNILRNMLPCSDQGVTELAAKAIAHYAVVSGSHTAEVVEFELKRALEWLQPQERNESRKLASVVLLKEFALVTPTFFFQQSQTFFDFIFNGIRDAKPVIREHAVGALRAALIITSQRETKDELKTQCYKFCYDEGEKCFEEGRDDRVHSGLLIFNELVRISKLQTERLIQDAEDLMSREITSYIHQKKPRRNAAHIGVTVEKQDDDTIAWLLGPSRHPAHESRTCNRQVSENIDKICCYVLRHKSSTNTAINRAVLLQLIPRLAAFNPEVFVRSYLNEAVSLIFTCFQKEVKTGENKAAIFLAIGLVCQAVSDGIKSHLPKIFELLRNQLPTRDTSKKKPVVPDPAVFTCISLMARALGTSVQANMRELLEPMFASGLSFSLNVALREITKHIAPLGSEIHDGLLKKLSLTLLGREMPNKLFALPGSSLAPQCPATHDVGVFSLALRTLGSFNFAAHSVEVFLNYIAEGYLHDEHFEIRLEAVHTTCCLLVPSLQTLARATNKQAHLSLLKMVHSIIYQILTTGISDPDSRIRLCVFESLSDVFDPHLAQPECLQVIFMGLQDEQYELREAVITLLGRLGEINPAYVMPTLRKVLVQLLGELNFSGIGRNKEQSARFLAQLTASSPKFMKPYIQPVLKSLIQKLQEHEKQADVIVGILTAVGEIAQIDGNEMLKHLNVIMPLVIEFLQDSSSIAKRQVSLWTLGQVVESTSYAVDPYLNHPELLDTLLRFLKTEQTHSIRRETIRVLGILGALDPYKQKIHTGHIDTAANSTGLALSMCEAKQNNDPRQEIVQWFHWERCTLEEFYPAIAVASLMHIVQDSALTVHHTTVVQAIMYIFHSLGTKCLPFLNQVVPNFIQVIRSSDANFREFLFQNLAALIGIVTHHVKPYLPGILQLIKDFWTPSSVMRPTIIALVEALASALGPDFKPYVPELLPAILKVFMYDNSADKTVTEKLLDALKVCGQTIEEYLHLIVPPIVKIIDSSDTPQKVRKSAIETLEYAAFSVKLNSYAARIIHPLARLLRSPSEHELIEPALRLIRMFVIQMQQDFLIFRPLVDGALLYGRVGQTMRSSYDQLLQKLLLEGKVTEADDKCFLERKQAARNKQTTLTTGAAAAEPATGAGRRSRINYANLEKAWNVNKCISKDDWTEWLRRLSLEFLKESPYDALRACFQTAQSYFPLARDLFNAAFISCWTELQESYQDQLIRSLEKALSVHDAPEITQTILNLAEFMDHSEKGPLPISPSLLGERALKTRAYAKALRYKEYEFLHKDQSTYVLEALISINNKLQLPEDAAGVVEYARKHDISVAIRERWYEKLHDWERALDAYERKLEQTPQDLELSLGRMRCLEALGQWNKLHTVAKDKWDISNTEVRSKFARMAAAAAWGLGQWDCMEEYLCYLNRNSLDRAFYGAVEAIHANHLNYAQQLIDIARDIVDTDLTALAGESYDRAYGAMVQVQMLTELEEAILFKLLPERQSQIRQIWWNRLENCQENVEDWYKLLKVRSLVMSAQDMRKTWLKFASLCRKNKKLEMAHRTLASLGADVSGVMTPPIALEHPDLTYAVAKQQWQEEKRDDAIAHLRIIVDSLKQPNTHPATETGLETQEVLRLKARCYLKLGQWQESIPRPPEVQLTQIMQCYRAATECDRGWYKAWHALAQSNFDAVLYYKEQMQAAAVVPAAPFAPVGVVSPVEAPIPVPPAVSLRALSDGMISMYAVSAIQCFFRAISLSKGSGLQDTLRLLTLWFDYGHNTDVYDALVDGIKCVPIETWLQVIPQLMARIDTPRQLINRLIIQLLMDIGKVHPQALVYPLSVASKSASVLRQQSANRILKHMKEHCAGLVSQAKLVSEELIRVAILWHELWHEGLEEASRQYFAEKNVHGMLATLEPLHNMIEQGPTTLKETSFNQAYYRDLKEAHDWCQKFLQTKNVKDLTQAWDLYYHVFRRISKQLPQLTSLELQYVSPKLMTCRDLELAVPGTYDPARPLIRIALIEPNLQVITSKQRPRKVTIKGSDGLDYVFLLKGHEDPRQDERVMQLFGLVNTLLLQNPDTCRRNLTIQRYSVIPLSQNSGLIGWVPNCDTLHALLRDYREKKKILLNIEHKLMQQMAPDYDHLTLMQKVEVFEHALERTSGVDLARIIWLKSPSSEVWFDRRTNYTRSLATMSMVGYMLGLGDRHPSNLMLDRMSGKIVHIDFGDCFEVAMVRDKYPEKIPFRLTRMLVSAMEVTGIEGNYRLTCERVLSLLREHRDSLMAVLEAFVYDPLINWRLLENQTTVAKPGQAENTVQLPDKDIDVAVLGNEVAPHLMMHQETAVQQPIEAVNKKAVQILQRIRDKLTGRDFNVLTPCNTNTQVQLLVDQATSHENLCQCYIGWCPFW